MLSGGGMKGLQQLGALHYFVTTSALDLSHIKEYAGTSAGSMMCLLLCCGYTPVEILHLSDKISKALDEVDVSSTIHTLGLLPITPLAQQLAEIVSAKLGSVPTLEELFHLTGKKLSVCVTNLSTMQEMRFDHITHPHISCVDVVKMSCSLPFIFGKIRYGEDYVTDGGFTNNFPWDYISGECRNILGIVSSEFADRGDISKTLNYIYRVLAVSFVNITRLKLHTPSRVSVVKIDWLGGSNIVSFGMERKMREEMFRSGYRQASYISTSKVYEFEGVYDSPSPSPLSPGDSSTEEDWGWGVEGN